MKNGLALLLFLFLVPLPSQLYSQEQEPRELFAQAYSLFSKGNPAEAEELFRKTLEGKSLLEDYSLYFLGVISSSRGELESSRKYFHQLKQAFPQSVWSANADLQSAKLSLAERNYRQAMSELRTVKSLKAGEGIIEESLYLLGRLNENLGEWTQAYSAYQELRRTYPLSPWSAKARKEVTRLRQEQPRPFGLTKAEALLEEGELLDRERQYPEAEKIYRALVDLAPRGPLRPRFLFFLSHVLRSSR